MIFSRKFIAIFSINTLGVLNDSMLRTTVLILIAFNAQHGSTYLSQKVYANIAVLLFNLPYLLISSYIGKLDDKYDKVKIIRWVKFSEIFIISVAAVGFILGSKTIIILSIFFLGIHSAFLSPIKFSLLPEYFESKNLKLAIGYIEAGIFFAVLVAQIVTSFFMSSINVWILIYIMLINAGMSLFLSFFLESSINHASKKINFSLNPFKDSWQMYKILTQRVEVKLNLWTLSWFWALSALFLAQLALFTKNYLGASIGVYGLLLTVLLCSITAGSIYSVHSKVQLTKLLTVAVLITNLGLIMLLALNNTRINYTHDFYHYLYFVNSWINIGLMLIIGLGLGIFSTSCYNQLLASTPVETMSQAVACLNQISSIVIFVSLGTATWLFLIIGQWWILFAMASLNFLFNLYYLYTKLLSK